MPSILLGVGESPLPLYAYILVPLQESSGIFI